MSILITGAAGFIGYHLATLYSQKRQRIYVVDNFARGDSDSYFSNLINKNNVTFLEGNLLSREFCQSLPHKDINTYFHLAAINGTANFYEKSYDVIKANILTLTNILDSIPENKSAKFIYTSSSEAYAGSVEKGIAPIPTPEEVPLTIIDPTNPRWSYGASKLLAEVTLFSYSKSRRIEPYVVRFHNIYGPRMGFKHVIPNFIEKIIKANSKEKNKGIEVLGSHQTRAFCYIQDTLKALEIIESEKIPSGTYNIGNDNEEIEIGDLFNLVSEALNGEGLKIKDSPAPKGSVSRRLPDISKLKQYGYIPKISLKEGLKVTVDWYRDAFNK